MLRRPVPILSAVPMLAAAVVPLGCGEDPVSPAPPGPTPRPAPGPRPLRDAAHMTSFLADASWRSVRMTPQLVWRFEADGTFELPGAGACAAVHSGLGCDRVAGVWAATEDVLSLSELRTADGAELPGSALSLKWLDGKLNLEIGGVRRRRRPG